MRTYIDLQETYKGLFLTSKRLKNRLIRYWGTETIDGVKVFRKKFTAWPNTDRPAARKILKMFGIWDQVYGEKFKGITKYYLWFNPDKLRELDDITEDILVNKINSIIPQNIPFSVNLNFTDPGNPTRFLGRSSEYVFNYLIDNYSTLIDSQYIEARGDTLAQEAIGLYILLGDGSDFRTELVEATVTPIEHVTRNIFQNSRFVSYTTGISVEFTVTKIDNVGTSSPMIIAMAAENDQLKQRKLAEFSKLESDTSDFDWVSTGTGTTDEIWYKGQLRVETTDSSYLDRDKFTEIISSTLDTGYKKKKTKWYKKILAIVVVVVVFWLSGGFSAVTFSAFAASLGVTSLVLAGIQLALASSSDTGFTEYFGKIVQVVGVASTFTGIAAFIQNIGKNTFLQGLKTAAGAGDSAKFLLDQAVTAVKEAVAEATTAVSKLANEMSITNAVDFMNTKVASVASKLVKKLVSMRVSTAAKEVRDLEDKVEQSREELDEISDKEMHIGVEDIKYYTESFKQDNMQFNMDYQFGGTQHNIGRPSFYPIGLNIRDLAYEKSKMVEKETVG